MRLAIFGAGGFGREIARFAEDAMPTGSSGCKVVFVSDFEEPITNGRPVLRLKDLDRDNDRLVIAVADYQARREIAARCEAAALRFTSIRAANATAYDDVTVEAGAIICAGAILTSNIRIGRHFHLNLNSYVAHDCDIGDFVTFAPGVCCNGGVTIEDDVYVGTGALLKPRITIGKGAVIGMGAVVTKDVPPGATVVGNPAQPIARA